MDANSGIALFHSLKIRLAKLVSKKSRAIINKAEHTSDMNWSLLV